MIMTERHDKKLREVEQKSFYSIAKYLYLIRSEEDNKHARLISLMEMIPKFLSYILIAELKEAASIPLKEKELLLTKIAPFLQTPSFGDWKEVLRVLLSDLSSYPDPNELPNTSLIIDKVWTERKGLESLQRSRKKLFDIIQQIKPKYMIRRPNSSTIRLFDILDMLVTYRNAFYGHGDISNYYEYQQHNQIIIDILIEFLDDIELFHSKKLAYLERVKYQDKQFHHELYVSSGRHIDFERHTFVDTKVFDPEQVYLCDEVEDPMTGEKRIVPTLSLNPFIIYTFDRKENNRNLLFLGDLKENHVGYNGFPSNYFYEPSDPKAIYQSFFEINTEKLSVKQTYSEGDYIAESQNSFSGKETARVYEMVSPAESPQIWENFEDVYYAYNAPFQLEKETNLDGLVEKHKIRYENTMLKKTKYLFFLGNPNNADDLQTFSRRLDNFLTFMRRLHERIPTILETKLEIYIVRSEFPNITFFSGKKMGNPYGIIYFHNQNFLVDDMPKIALLTRDESLLSSLDKNFENDLNGKAVVKYFISDLLKQDSVIEKVIKDLSYTINVRKRFNHFTSDVSLIESISKHKQESGQNIYHLGLEKSPFYFQYLLRDMFFSQMSYDHQSFHLKELKEKALNFYGDIFQAGSEKLVMVSEDLEGMIFNILLAVEGDLLLPIPAPQSFIKMARKMEDQVIHVPLYFNGVKITSPNEFEEVILRAKAEGKNPKKLLLNHSSHDFWLEWDKKEILAFTDICKRHGILIILDGINESKKEVFSYLMENLADSSILVTELSPYLSLDGYKMGTIFFPKTLDIVYDTISFLSESANRALPRIMEHLALQYYQHQSSFHNVLKKCNSIYRHIGTYVKQQLNAISDIDYHVSSDAYEVYIDFENYRDALELKGIRTNLELTIDILEKVNLVVIPGILFGEYPNKLRLGIRLFNFDGNQAVETLEDIKSISPEEFVEQFCPSIKTAIIQLQSYFEKCKEVE
ncbi:MAG: hypothetical protein Q8934_07565 [Bacillota bacterium]|nr:hypothetical protein [Bacillota bacterium]